MLTFFLQSGLEFNNSYEKTLIENAKGNLHSMALYASSNQKQNVNHSQAQMCLNSGGDQGRARNSHNRGRGGRFIYVMPLLALNTIISNLEMCYMCLVLLLIYSQFTNYACVTIIILML